MIDVFVFPHDFDESDGIEMRLVSKQDQFIFVLLVEWIFVGQLYEGQ